MESADRDTRRPGWLFCLVLAWCLAIVVCWVSENLNTRFQSRKEIVAGQLATLQRAPFVYGGSIRDLPEFRGRVLFPTLLVVSQRLGIGSEGAWFLIWRVTTAFVLFLLLLRLTPGPWPWVALAGALFAYLLILSFNGGEQPTDFPDVAFTLGFCALALRRSYGWLVLVTILAGTNRESAAFAGIIWCCLHGWPLKWRELGWGALLSVVGYGVALALRHQFAIPGESDRVQTIGLMWLPRLVREFLQYPTPSSWPVLLAAALIPVAWMLWAQRQLRTQLEHRLIGAAVIVGGVTLLLGIPNELRVFLPMLTILSYAALLTGDRIWRQFSN